MTNRNGQLKHSAKIFQCEVTDLKKSTINISYYEEKLNALKIYLEQKGSRLEDECIKALDALYTKTVPAGVREFISMKAESGKSNASPSSAAGGSKKEMKTNG